MKVTRISVGRTYNLGNYESLRIEVTVEPETPEETVRDLTNRAIVEIREENKYLRTQIGK